MFYQQLLFINNCKNNYTLTLIIYEWWFMMNSSWRYTGIKLYNFSTTIIIYSFNYSYLTIEAYTQCVWPQISPFSCKLVNNSNISQHETFNKSCFSVLIEFCFIRTCASESSQKTAQHHHHHHHHPDPERTRITPTLNSTPAASDDLRLAAAFGVSDVMTRRIPARALRERGYSDEERALKHVF